MKARDSLFQALCVRVLRFGETHGGQPSRTRCHFTDNDQKMQKFPIAASGSFPNSGMPVKEKTCFDQCAIGCARKVSNAGVE